MPVTLDISNQNIKIVSMKGTRIDKWETASTPSGAIKDGQIQLPQSLAESINSIFNSLRLPRNEVIVNITGLPYIYRILNLPNLKPNRLQEAILRATQKEVQFPTNELYVDWQIVAIDEGEIQVFVVGVPRNALDSLVQTMKLANVNLTSIDLKPLALARAANQTEALIANFDTDCFDIIIISEGLPVTLHTVIPKSSSTDPEDSIHQLGDNLARTIDFYNLTHKEKPISPNTPVLLTGTLALQSPENSLNLKSWGHPVQSLMTRLKAPADFPGSTYASNLGLALKNKQSRKTIKPADNSYCDININLLLSHRRALTHPVSLRKTLVPVSLTIAVLLLLPLSMLRNQAASDTVNLHSELSRADYNLALEQQAVFESETSQDSINTLDAETAAIQKELQLAAGKETLSDMIKSLTGNLPAGATFTGINSSSDTVKIEGKAASRQNIIDYAKNLERQNKFSEVRIALISEDEPDQPTGATGSCSFKIVIGR